MKVSLAMALLPVVTLTTVSFASEFPTDVCELSALQARKSERNGVRSDYFLSLGRCANILDPAERGHCIAEAFFAFHEGLAETRDRFEARLDLCELVGPAAYDPVIDPADFVAGIDNPWMPLVPGSALTYLKETDEETEVIVVTVTDLTREIQGVECTVVQDTVTIDGVLIEDTFDYFAQDVLGNVWYFGEISMNYEDGFLVDLDGSWESGRDGARAGIVMPAVPIVGATYRQEFLLGEAEDAATLLDDAASVDVPFGSFANCLQTLDFTPLEPGAVEFKFFAPSIGLVLEVDPESGERLELVGVTP